MELCMGMWLPHLRGVDVDQQARLHIAVLHLPNGGSTAGLRAGGRLSRSDMHIDIQTYTTLSAVP